MLLAQSSLFGSQRGAWVLMRCKTKRPRRLAARTGSVAKCCLIMERQTRSEAWKRSKLSLTNHKKHSETRVTDAKSAFDHLIRKPTGGHCRRTAQELCVIRRSMQTLRARCRWVPHERMVVDALTKRPSMSSSVCPPHSACYSSSRASTMSVPLASAAFAAAIQR